MWFLPSGFQTYPDILDEEGYFTGFTGKGWGPGNIEDAGRSHNPAGYSYNEIKHIPFEEYGIDGQIYNVNYVANFKSFIDSLPNDQPFLLLDGNHRTTSSLCRRYW
jgi:N-sulfoglucosamine sulfohydrolase